VFHRTCDAPGDAGAVGGSAQVMAAPPPQAIGEIQTVIGPATVISASGAVVEVKVGNPVRQHDTIETGADGAVSVTFKDGTAFKLSNNARMALTEFVSGPNGTSDSALFSLRQGAFTFIGGKAAKSGGLRIDTPVAAIRGTSQAGGSGILTLGALIFSAMNEIQAASRPDPFLDDDTITPKDLPHGTFTILNKVTGEVTEADDPTVTYEFAPDGSVTRTPKTSSQVEQGAAIAQQTASLSLGQGAAPGGSSTPTFDIPLQLQPINFTRPENNAVPNQVTINITPTSSGLVEAAQLKPPPPVLAADAGPHPIIEFLNTTGSPTPNVAPSVSLSFTDLKLSTITASLASIAWSGGDTLPSGLSTVLASALTTSASADSTGFSGSVNVTFGAADDNFDFLAANETLTVVYNVTVTDSNGVSVTQPLMITVTGTNDAPGLAADASGPHTVAENLNATRTLTFTDADLNDHHTVSTSVTSATWSGGATLPSGLAAALPGALSTTTTDSTGSGSGSIAVTFSAADSAFDFLAAGQTLTVTYNITVTDNNGVSSTQSVTIIVTGTNDGAVIGDPAVHDVTEDANAGNLTASGTLSISDADQGQASFQTGVTGAQDNLGSLTLQANGSYIYTVANSAVQYLGTNDTKVDTFTVTAFDGTTKQISFTIHGANDAALLTVAATTSSYTTNGPAVTLLSAATVSDVDNPTLQSATVTITDFVTGDVLAANAAGTSITASFDAATGVLTLTGDDTLAHYQQVLDSVTYTSTSGNPTNSGTDTSRTISWVVNDGTLDSATQTTTLNITAPVVVTITAGQPLNLNGDTLVASSIEIESGGILSGFGTVIAGVIENNGRIQSQSNNGLTITISGSITGTGSIEIKNNSTLTLEGPVGSGQTVLFSVDPGGGAATTLVLSDPSHFDAQILDFHGSDQIEFPTIDSGLATRTWVDNGVAGDNTGGTLTISDGTTTAVIHFADGDYTIDNFKLDDDGSGGTLLKDPPASTTTTDATVTPIAETSTPTATETMSSRRKVTYVTDDDGIMVALSTAVAFAVSAAVSDADGSEMSGLTSDGNDTAVDLTGTGSDSFRVDSGAAPKFSPISHRTTETLAEDGTVEVINGKLQIAGAVSETGMLEIDAGATLQLDGSGAVDAPVIADETNADAINLPGDYSIKTAWHFSDDGGGGKSIKDLSISATAEDTSSQSTSADNGFVVSSPFAATLSGNGDPSAFQFKPNLDHHAATNPEPNDIANGLLQHPADNLLHTPAQHNDSGSPVVTDGAHPAHPHSDGDHPANPKFADDGSDHPGKVPHDPPALAANDLSGEHSAHPFKPNSDHHPSADPETSDTAKDHLPQHAADNLPHGPAQHDDNGSPTVTEGVHPAHPHSDGDHPANPKFADDGSAHPGKVPHDPPTALSSDLSGERSAHPSKPNSDHHASAGPGINDLAKDHQHPADNLPHGPAQHADSGSPAVTDGPHPAHPHFDANQPDSFKFADNDSADPGPVPHDPPTALWSDVSGDHSASPVKPNLDHPASADPEIKDIAKDHPLQHPADNLAHGPAQLADNGSPADDSFKFADNGSTHPGTIKPDTIEIDPITAAEIKHLLDIPDADAVSALDPTHAPAPQDMTKVQVPHQGDFHFA
jgi:VCBS repeat-containing protein